ncbi:hypothetical protein ABFT23_03440 [Nocardioides sp. C4-1]|uniref:CG0192-related protein n=1 Tax=Nocardioides sp. C4-1 TaxID=3151851 RepID=UPI00326435B9
MAVLHRASISPTKAELLQAWVPHRSWYAGSGPLTTLGAYRLDDPDGEVGTETFLLRAGDGPVLQAPLTYRAAPLEGAERDLVCEMTHSVLGPRWVYDGLADPVYRSALVSTVLGGGRQADLQVDVDGVLTPRETTTFVQGSGSPGVVLPSSEVIDALERHEVVGCTVLAGPGLEVTLCRVVTTEPGFDVAGQHTLTGRWPDHSTPTVLAAVRAG